MNPLVARVRSTLAPLAPGHRRWVRFLHGLPLDLGELPATLPEPRRDDVIICGCPRTGTTLLSAALFQPPRAISVMEPWDGMRMPPAELFASLRDEIARTGRLTRGRLDLDALDAKGTAEWCQEGAAARDVEVAPDYRLLVKWPGYWQFLDRMPDARFIVCLRHPAEVVASFRKIGGRVAEGLQYDTAFNRRLNEDLTRATSDRVVRRVLLFDYVHERVLPHLARPNVFVVRYERWYQDRDALLSELSAFLGTDVSDIPVRLKQERDADLSPEEWTALRDHCRTADALGYDLGR